ncbi:hypothetical protein AB5I41_13575 [Sphingomonas sp. MMS24-JH45]
MPVLSTLVEATPLSLARRAGARRRGSGRRRRRRRPRRCRRTSPSPRGGWARRHRMRLGGVAIAEGPADAELMILVDVPSAATGLR